MKRIDLIGILFLVLAVILIYHPVFYSEYLYTDEASQLWWGGKGLNFNTSVPQGRWLTYALFIWIFHSIHTVHEIIQARLISLFGWIICLPVWYYIIAKLVERNDLPKMITPLALVYLVCSPPFTISVGWASCLELFIACTAGLVSGYALYDGIKNEDANTRVAGRSMTLAILLGLVALFTYQNGFGCFYIPFLIHFLAAKKMTKTVRIGLIFSLLIFAVYYLTFRYTLRATGLPASDRSSFTMDPIGKLRFFLTHPLASAFHFTGLFSKRNMLGWIIYGILALTLLVSGWIRQRTASLSEKFAFLSGLGIFFVLIYLPSLIVKENYASNRTLLALDLAVFFLVADTLFPLLKKDKTRWIVTAALAAIFLTNAGYNFNTNFRQPLVAEYRAIGGFLALHDTPGIDTICFIRPQEDAFERQYGITASWDEFGQPSTFKSWTPDPLIRQLIAEQTGDLARAEKMTIRSWPDQSAFLRSGMTQTPGTLLIDAEALITQPQAAKP